MIVCAGIGLAVTQRHDGRLAAGRHAALRLALDEVRAAFGDTGRFNNVRLRFIARRSGLADLRFDADLTADGGREVQSLHDGKGRIVGWFSWTADRTFVRAMNRLWGLVGAVGVALVLGAAFALHAAQRLARSLARGTGTVRKSTSEDALTGLPSHRGATRRFKPPIETEHAERRFLLHELESAILRQAFDVHYQPIVAADGAGIVGVEALLRWHHPRRGEISPSVFVPLAEQSGRMSQLGEIVLRRALTDAVSWPNLFVAVNLSPLQIRDRRLVELVGAVMAETGVAPSQVVLEVTEGVFIDNPRETRGRLEALRALGASIALDDFGTGYSSLSYLQKFPFDRLKIDRAFVAPLGASGNSGAIIQSIVTLGHALGMKVLAEGVETDAQRVLLRLVGCDEMQGYLFAKPAAAAEIDRALTRPARPATGRSVASAR